MNLIRKTKAFLFLFGAVFVLVGMMSLEAHAANNAGNFNVTDPNGLPIEGWSYNQNSKCIQISGSGTYKISGSENAGETYITINSNLNVTLQLNAIYFNTSAEHPALSIGEGTNLTLQLIGYNYIRNYRDQFCGLSGGNNCSVTITNLETNAGSLELAGGGTTTVNSAVNLVNGTLIVESGNVDLWAGDGACNIFNIKELEIWNGNVNVRSNRVGDSDVIKKLTILNGSFASNRNIYNDSSDSRLLMYPYTLKRTEAISSVIVDDTQYSIAWLSNYNSSSINQVMLYLPSSNGNNSTHTVASYAGENNTERIDKVFLSMSGTKGSYKLVNQGSIDSNRITVQSLRAKTITLSPLDSSSEYGNVEYKLGENGNWQTSSAYNNLSPETNYTVFVRYAGNDIYLPSDATSINVKTLKVGTVTEPLGLSAIYGQKLADITLPEGWSWVTDETSVLTGMYSYPARFNTTNLENTCDFSEETGYDAAQHYVQRVLTVQALRADSSVEITSENINKAYDGIPLSEPSVTKAGSTNSVQFTWYEKNGNTWDLLTAAPVNAGSYKVKASVEADDNYNGASDEKEFTISPASVTNTVNTNIDTNITYTGEMIDVSRYFTPDTNVVNPTYSLLKGENDITGEGELSGSVLTVTKTGTFKIQMATDATRNYQAGTPVTAVLTVKDGAINYDISDNGSVYDGKLHGITVDVKIPAETTITYSEDGITYSEKNPQYTNVGSYTVYYRIEKSNYETINESRTITISPRPITVTAENKECIYGDEAELTYKADDLIEGDSLENIILEKAAGNDVGNYTIIVSQKAGSNPNYSITFVNGTYTIHSKDLAEANVVLGNSLIYNMKEQTQEIQSVTIGTLPVTYTVTGNKAIKVGTYEMILTGTGNFTGQKKVSYTIAEMGSTARETLSINTAIRLNDAMQTVQSAKGITIKWNKVSDADGYDVYVQYCGKKFSAKVRTEVTGGDQTSLFVKKINGKKINQKKNYKVCVAAWKLVDGKKEKLGNSLTFHVIGRKNTKESNVKTIRLQKKSFRMKVGKTAKIQAKAILEKPSGKPLQNHQIKKLRYISSDNSVATVSTSGKIKAVGKGTCTIHVYAYNGCAKKVKVTVK